MALNKIINESDLATLKEIAGERFEDVEKMFSVDYIPYSRFEEVNSRKKALEDEKQNLEKQFNELTTAHTANETKLKEHETTINELKTKFAARMVDAKIKENLVGAGVKHPELLMAQIDKTSLEYDEDTNEIKNIDEVVKSLKDKYSDMFNTEEKFKDNVKPQKNNQNDNVKINEVERYFKI
jgi:chromosome segregation ATPase